MKRSLITGGAGFIGGALVRRLLAEGHQVSILDLPDKIRTAKPSAESEIISGDISRADTFEKLNGSFDAVLHLAAQTSARVSHEEPERDIDTNARGTMLLAQWCVRHNVRRVLYGSSMGVFGNPPKLPVKATDMPAPAS